MSSAEERAVEAVQVAARKAVAFQAETHAQVIEQARKRQRTSSGEQEEDESLREVDDSDLIKAAGHSKSLMSLVREHGIKLYKKGWKNLTFKEKCIAEFS